MNTEPTIPTEPTVPTLETLANVMKVLEQKVNPNNVEEGLQQLTTAIKNNDPSVILGPMKAGAKEFEERIGRPMTYTEMREMWG